MKGRLALDVFEEPAGWGLVPPVVVAGVGYGQNAGFRHGLDGRASAVSSRCVRT